MAGSLKPADVVLRHAKIVRFKARHPSATRKDIAAACKVSERTVTAALAAKDSERAGDLKKINDDVAKYVAKVLAEYDELRETLMDLLDKKGVLDANRIGAVRAIMDLHEREIKLLQQTAMLPMDLGVVRFQADSNFVTEVVMDIIKELARTEKQRLEAEARVIKALTGQEEPLALTTGDNGDVS